MQKSEKLVVEQRPLLQFKGAVLSMVLPDRIHDTGAGKQRVWFLTNYEVPYTKETFTLLYFLLLLNLYPTPLDKV